MAISDDVFAPVPTHMDSKVEIRITYDADENELKGGKLGINVGDADWTWHARRDVPASKLELTPAEINALRNFINSKVALVLADTGLTLRWGG